MHDVVSDIREVLAHRGEVTIALEHDALRVVVVEEVVVPQRAGVLCPHRGHAQSGEALELLELPSWISSPAVALTSVMAPSDVQIASG